MRICITRSSRYAYSETFIRDQIAWFSDFYDVYPIHSGRFPERKEDDTLLSPILFWLLHKIFKIILGRNNIFSNYGMKKYFKNNEVNVVLANYGTSAAHMVPVCKALNIPLLVIFHGHDATDKKLLNEYKKEYKELFNYACYIIVVSEEMKSGILKLGAQDEKIKVIPCGVNTSKFKPETDDVQNMNFLAVGRFTPKKGPFYLLKSFQKVVKKYPKATLTMVGEKSGLYEECQVLVSELEIQDSVNFTGVLTQDKIADLMNSSLAFVQHSITAPNGDMEGTPVSIMEASATGLPVVSTLHGGIKDAVVHERTGFLVREKDINAMADYMLLFCEKPWIRKELGSNGRLHIQENYLQEKQLRKLGDLAEHAVRNLK